MNKKMTPQEAGRLGYLKSKETHQKQHEQIVKNYNDNPCYCQFCNSVLSYEKRHHKFCDASCAAKFNNKKRIKKIQNKDLVQSKVKDQKIKFEKEKLYSFCLNCGKKFEVKELKRIKKFCDNKCQKEFERKLKFQKIEEQGFFPFNPRINETDRKTVRQYLIAKFGHKCSICNLSEWQGQPIPLVADHIDGDTTNHKIENFRLVCENCNALLPTYKSKNKHGRAWRKKYYNNN